MIARLAELPKLAKGANANGWVGRIAGQVDILRETLASLTPGDGLLLTEDGNGRLLLGLADMGGGSAEENYGFRVAVNGSNRVQVAAGTAQVWGGLPKAYAATDIGTAHNGYYVYARCDLTVAPPAWDNALHYGNSLSQGWTAGDDLIVPIALVTVDGTETDVTQMHCGNIVVPAIANAVDVQQDSEPAPEESGS